MALGREYFPLDKLLIFIPKWHVYFPTVTRRIYAPCFKRGSGRIFGSGLPNSRIPGKIRIFSEMNPEVENPDFFGFETEIKGLFN